MRVLLRLVWTRVTGKRRCLSLLRVLESRSFIGFRDGSKLKREEKRVGLKLGGCSHSRLSICHFTEFLDTAYLRRPLRANGPSRNLALHSVIEMLLPCWKRHACRAVDTCSAVMWSNFTPSRRQDWHCGRQMPVSLALFSWYNLGFPNAGIRCSL